MTVIKTLLATYLFACYYFDFFFPQKVDVKKWVCVSTYLQRDRDINGCMFAVASNLFVLLPSVAGTMSIQNNCSVVVNTYFTSLQLEPLEVSSFLLLKWNLLKYSLSLEHYSLCVIGFIVMIGFWSMRRLLLLILCIFYRKILTV